MGIEIRCIIADEKRQWKEVLPVDSVETAKEDIQKILVLVRV